MSAILNREKSRASELANENEQRPDRRLLVGYLHKTSNTLCGIKGYASLIAERENVVGEAGQWARKIIREVERMEEIFRSVGDLTRGRGNPDTGINLPGFVADTATACSEFNRDIDLEVDRIPDGELRLPAADLALMLKEILLNCAESNGPDQERVKVELSGMSMPEGRIFLEIRDHGSGMEAELSAMASVPFVTTKDDHHGVGLTRVDTLMDMYGLHWSLDSEPGRGTRVLLEVAEAV